MAVRVDMSGEAQVHAGLAKALRHVEGAAFDHTAVAAPRLRDLLPVYRDLLGGTLAQGGDNEAVGYRAMQLRYTSGSKIELMEPLAGSSFFDSFFASRGSGVHHMTFKVPDIHGAIEVMTAHGYEPFAPNFDNKQWQEVFLHPRHAGGTVVQLAQSDAVFMGPPELSVEMILDGRGEQGNGKPSP